MFLIALLVALLCQSIGSALIGGPSAGLLSASHAGGNLFGAGASAIGSGSATAGKKMMENAFLKFAHLNDIGGVSAAQSTDDKAEKVPCTCGVFMSGQFDKGSSAQPRGHPALLFEQDVHLPCNAQGQKQCTNRCLEMIVKHLPNAPNIICGTIDRDCHRERAYLFVQNCNSLWTNTKLSAGREYCCKDGSSVPCPIGL